MLRPIQNPMCPSCKKEELLFQEVIEMKYDDEGTYLKVEGECLECGKRYRWIEIYEFSHNENIKEIK